MAPSFDPATTPGIWLKELDRVEKWIRSRNPALAYRLRHCETKSKHSLPTALEFVFNLYWSMVLQANKKIRLALASRLSFILLFMAPVMATGQEAEIDKGTPVVESETESERPDPTQFFEPREYSDTAGNILKYRLLKPVDFDPNDQYPLVIFLHGAGERGDDNAAQLKHGMPDFCISDRREKFPCYVLAPQCPKGQKWADVDWSLDHVKLPKAISPSMKLVLEVVDQMLKDAAIDRNRVYICGLSMGGYGSWDAMYRRPDFFAAAMPICGGADPVTAERIQHVPIWCFHGGSDGVVKPEFSRDMIAALKKAGGSPKYTEYPGVGHDSWTETFANPEVYDWLFAQRRKSKPHKD